MSVLSTILIGWLTLNVVVVAALLTRRARPQLRERLFRWVIRGETKRRPHGSHGHSRPSRA